MILAIIILILPVLYGKESYKEWLLYEINSYTEMKFNYSDSTLIFLPHPGILLKNVTIYKNYVVTDSLTNARSVSFLISLKTIDSRKLTFSDIIINGITINITRSKTGNFSILHESNDAVSPSPDKNFSENKGGLRTLMNRLDLESLTLQDSEIYYNDIKFGRKYRFSVRRSEIGRVNSNNWYWNHNGYIDRPESKIKIESDFLYLLNDPEDELKYSANINVKYFPAHLLGDIMNSMNKTDFSKTLISGDFRITKNNKYKIESIIDSRIQGLSLKNGKSFSPMQFSGKVTVDTKEKTLAFNQAIFDWPSHAYLYGSGSIYLRSGLPMSFSIFSEHANFHSVLDFIQALHFEDPGTDANRTGKNATRIFNLRLKNVTGYDNRFNTITGQVIYIDPIMLFNKLNMNIYEGNIMGNGSVDFRDLSFRYSGEAENVDAAKLINNYSKVELISGKLKGKIKILTTVNSEEEFFSRLKGVGNFAVTDGELLGYANATLAIASVGKLLNVLGPPGKSTSFKYIKSDFTVKNSSVRLSHLELKGVGLDAEAKGRIGLDSSIDMRVTLSLGGPVGTVLKIPVIYRGTINKDDPYVDPVWVSSVAFGSTMVLPGNPVGGVMVGSFLSDYIRDFMDLFSNDEEKELDEIDNPKKKIEGR